MFAGITILFLIANNLCPSTIISRAIIIIGKNGGINSSIAKQIIIELISILSAIGSQIFPISVTQLYFLAIKPSKKSVKDAIQNKTPEIIKNK